MNMTMKGNHWIPFLNEPFDRNAADMNVKGNMINFHPVERSTVQFGLIWRGVEQYDRTGKIIFTSQCVKVLLNGAVFNVLSRVDGPDPFCRSHTSRIDITGNIISFPIFQPERSGRNTGIPVN